MKKYIQVIGAYILFIGLPSMVQAQGTASPEMILKEVVSGMPKGERQNAGSDGKLQAGRQDRVPYASIRGNGVYLGRCIHVRARGACASRREGGPSIRGTAKRKDDGLQPQ